MNNRPNTRSVTDQTGVSIADAAERLGMTSEAIRMRLKRGTLPGAKIDGRWVVYLEATEHPPKHSEQPTEHPTERDVGEVDHLRSEIHFLRGLVEQLRHDQAAERERFDVIHREALQRIEALTAGPGADDAGHDAGDEPSDRPGREEGANVGQESMIAGLWRRLTGR